MSQENDMQLIEASQEWFIEQSKIVYREILNDIDKNKYWHPKINEEKWPTNEPKHNTFEQAYMKFLNGNLNYYHFPNMVVAAREENNWNESFPKSIEFCNAARTITGNKGPLGRMCVWDLPPGKRLLPHTDDFEYHRHIVRNIFVVSPNIEDKTQILIKNKKMPTKQGTFFQFLPHSEEHEFVNNSDEHFYFLGYDYWILQKLQEAEQRVNIADVANDKDRIKFDNSSLVYGSIGTRYKYQSDTGLNLEKLQSVYKD